MDIIWNILNPAKLSPFLSFGGEFSKGNNTLNNSARAFLKGDFSTGFDEAVNFAREPVKDYKNMQPTLPPETAPPQSTTSSSARHRDQLKSLLK